MREKVVIRCLTKKEYIPYIKPYPELKKKWITYSDELATIVVGYMDDPEFREFCEYLPTKKEYMFSYIERKYTKEELAWANLFLLSITAVFEPAGEECGTEYEFHCLKCKAGRVPKDNLILNLAKVPKGKDIARTISEDEWIISEKLAELMHQAKIKGFTLKPVTHYTKYPIKKKWYQLKVNSVVEISKQTRFGNIFQPDIEIEKQRTECGHAIKFTGGNLSEFYIKKSSWDGSDIVRSRLYFGVKHNLLTPAPVVFLSQKFYRLLKDNNIKDYEVEVARFEGEN